MTDLLELSVMTVVDTIHRAERRLVDAETVLRGDPTVRGDSARRIIYDARSYLQRLGAIVKHFTTDSDLGPLRRYRRTVVLRARQMDEPFVVATPHGLVQGEAGDYLCEDSDGELYPCRRSVFEAGNPVEIVE